jgi:serine/threonine-protein kinase
MYEPTSTTYTTSSDEALIAQAIESLPRTGDRHHTIVQLEDQTVCLSVARAPANDECWSWFATAAGERADLTSDRLLPLVSAGNFDGWFYVAHDIGSAVPLSEYRRTSDPSTQRTLSLLLGIAHGLDEAVRQGKPPCEVTPDSVFLDPRLGAMVGDLGVAREALGNPPADDDPHAAWVAPEVLLGEGPHPRSAVYSFGAIAYTLLTGRPPHTGDAQQIAHARAPRISEARPDLPATLDTVFAVAMAHEPSKRYATAAEARHLLNLVMYGAPTVPALESSPRFRRGNGSAKAAKAQEATTPAPVARIRPVIEEHPHRGRVLVGLLVAGAVAAGVVAGSMLAGDSNAPAAPQSAEAAGMTLDLPSSWRQEPARAGQIAASPAGDQKSGLVIARTKEPVTRADQAAPVLLGTYQAWQHDEKAAGGRARKTLFVIPTANGKITVTCTAAGGSAGLLALCERTASTLHIDGQHTLGLATVVANHQRWRALALKLRSERAAARSSLAQADRQTGQIAVAERLAGIHEQAAKRFAELTGGAGTAAAARDVAGAYRGLAAAARRDSPSAWASARAKLSAAESRLERDVAGR